MQDLLGESNNSTGWQESPLIPDFLIRRMSPENLLKRERYVDDHEVTLMGILEEDGKISLFSNVILLIVFMTRVHKVCLL